MKKILLLVSIFCCVAAANSPTNDFITSLSQKIELYYRENPQEQVQLFFNQEKYAPSDTAFFQAYLLTEYLINTKSKKILSLGILNSSNKLIQNINFRLNEGSASNQIIIPPGIEQGLYHFVIYDPNSQISPRTILFEREFSIVSKNKFYIKDPNLDSVCSIAYEGGNFISGLENNIIIKSRHRGIVKVKNDENQEVGSAEIGEYGICNILFIPKVGTSYFAEVNSQANRQPLRIAKEDGCLLRISEPKDNQSRTVSVSVPLISNLKSKNLYVVVTNKRKIVFYAPVAFNQNSHFEVTIPNEYLNGGLSEADVFNDDGALLAKRVFFTELPNINADIQSLPKTAKLREKIDIQFTLRDRFGKPLQGEFTTSIFQKNLFEKKSVRYKADFLNNLPSEITKNRVVDFAKKDIPHHFIDKAVVFANSGLIPWSEINNVRPLSQRTMTSSNLKIKGKAIFKNSRKPVKDSTLIIGYLQNSMIGYEAFVTKDGNFEMPFLFDFDGNDELFYFMEFNGKELSDEYEIIQDVAALEVIRSTSLVSLDSIDVYGSFSTKRNIIEKSFNYFSSHIGTEDTSKNLSITFEDELMGADYTVKVQDYLVFPTMEELTREVIPFLQHRKRGKESVIQLLLKQKTGYHASKGTPLFLIDGELSKNKNVFLNLRPVDLVNIKIINDLNKLSRLGVLGRNGIVLVETKRPLKMRKIENNTIISVQGINRQLPFKSTIKGDSRRIPSLKSTLFWKAKSVTDAYGNSNISFYTSNQVGTIGINIKGFTKFGDIFEINESFNVAFSK